jgi:hypothetical protein
MPMDFNKEIFCQHNKLSVLKIPFHFSLFIVLGKLNLIQFMIEIHNI